MLTSLALIFLVGLAMSAICKQIRLPGIIGMLATGIVLGPYVLDLLSPSILGISADLRRFPGLMGTTDPAHTDRVRFLSPACR